MFLGLYFSLMRHSFSVNISFTATFFLLQLLVQQVTFRALKQRKDGKVRFIVLSHNVVVRFYSLLPMMINHPYHRPVRNFYVNEK
jgi:hypothetical protein